MELDPSRLTAEEVENLRLRCQLRGSYGTAAEFNLPELLLLRAMIGLQVPEVVTKVRPMLRPLLAELEARKENRPDDARRTDRRTQGCSGN